MPYGVVHHDLRQMLGSLRTTGIPAGTDAQFHLPQWPFVTISRQAGAGGLSLGRILAQRLSAMNSAEQPWQCLHRELVEMIAADHHLSTDLVESLEHSSHTWIAEFIGGLSRTDRTPSELTVFRRVVETVRALARAGHVVLVELGSVFITRDMPGGLHVRLVAPLEWRVRNLAKFENISEGESRKRVKLLDDERAAFLRKFWPTDDFSAERFHLTLNAGKVSEEHMADCIIPLVRQMQPA